MSKFVFKVGGKFLMGSYVMPNSNPAIAGPNVKSMSNINDQIDEISISLACSTASSCLKQMTDIFCH